MMQENQWITFVNNNKIDTYRVISVEVMTSYTFFNAYYITECEAAHFTRFKVKWGKRKKNVAFCNKGSITIK